MGGDRRWHPWSALRARDHLRLGFARLPDELGGSVYWPRGGRAAIVIDPTLGRRQRRAALAHELVHDERGGGCHHDDMPDTWTAVVARDETLVAREVARRLVPLDELQVVVDDLAGLGLPVLVHEIAEAFDVPDDVARLALDMLSGRLRPPT